MRINHKITLLILLVGCTIFFSPTIFAQNVNDFPAKRDPATNLNIEREKAEIYPKLRDKRCTTMTIDQCNCPDAREMRAYIEALIETGANKDEIFYRVAKKFTLNTILDEQIKQNVEKRLIKEAGQTRPQIIIKPTSFDFGKVSKKQGKISKKFKLYNKGNSNLTIKNIKTSCPCATVSLKVNPVRNKTPKVSILPSARISNGVNKKKTPYFGTEGSPKDWRIEVKPGEIGEIELMVDLARSDVKPGKLIRDTTITSNDPVYPEIAVTVEAEVTD